MKTKHNKKRNTAFLFEALVRELTKSIVGKDSKRKRAISQIIRESYKKGSLLASELSYYKDLTESSDLSHHTAEKLIHRIKYAHNCLDKKKLFQEQSTVVKRINKELGNEVFNNFVPNYKDMASICQIFGERTPVKEKVLLENKLLEKMVNKPEQEKEKPLKPIDSFVISSFSESFSKKYEGLLPEQKDLLVKYISSIGENNVDFRVHLVEVLTDLRGEVEKSMSFGEVKEDENMLKATKRVLQSLDEINVVSFSEKQMLKVLKIQNLVNEYKSNAN